MQAQLSKAVDGAALGAARMLNSGNPQQEAASIYRANFPNGWMGTTSSTSPSDSGFFSMTTDGTTGVNVVNVRATAVVPTTFMKLANFQELTVNAQGEATRRMVDLSLVLDVSSSIGIASGRRFATRRARSSMASRPLRIASRSSCTRHGARVVDAMPAGRGFDKARVMADIPNSLPGGSTSWSRASIAAGTNCGSVPNGQQSGLRVIVLFTDGASNSVPGIYPGSATSRGLRTSDFPKRYPDPDNRRGTARGSAGSTTRRAATGAPSYTCGLAYPWNSTTAYPSVPRLPLTSFHSYRRSGGIPTSFPLVSTSADG